jgi:hypothetical protein
MIQWLIGRLSSGFGRRVPPDLGFHPKAAVSVSIRVRNSRSPWKSRSFGFPSQGGGFGFDTGPQFPVSLEIEILAVNGKSVVTLAAGWQVFFTVKRHGQPSDERIARPARAKAINKGAKISKAVILLAVHGS